MFRTLIVCSILALSNLAHGAPADPGKAAASAKATFGSPITLKQTTTLTEAAHAATPADTEVLVEAEIRQVCQAKGCWMEISDGKTQMRVAFKGYAFFVPKDAGGKKARIQGQVVEKKESVAEQRHYLKDAGAGKKELDAVKEPKTVRSFVASGVEISS